VSPDEVSYADFIKRLGWQTGLTAQIEPKRIFPALATRRAWRGSRSNRGRESTTRLKRWTVYDMAFIGSQKTKPRRRHRALGLKPWEASPLDAATPEPPQWMTDERRIEDWKAAYELRSALLVNMQSFG
jgi:hypothetical protein